MTEFRSLNYESIYKNGTVGFLHGAALYAASPQDTAALNEGLEELAQQLDPKQELVAPFSDLRVDLFKHSLKKEEQTRFRYQLLVGTGVALACGYATYHAARNLYFWWKDKAEEDTEQKRSELSQLATVREKAKALAKRVKKLEKNIRIQDKQVLANTTWPQYLAIKAKRVALGTTSLIPSVGYSLASAILFVQGQSIARYALPKVGDYLFEGRTIAWCIERRTKLKQAIRDLANWADELVENPCDESIELTCLLSSMNIFVLETEKVVGYMNYITDQLTNGNERERERALVCMNVIEKLTGNLVTKSNDLITGKEKLTENTRAECALFMKTTLSTLINQMEKFEVVQEAAGYENLDRTGTFDALKALLIPEVKKLRAEVKEFKVLLSQLRAAAAAAEAEAQEEPQ